MKIQKKYFLLALPLLMAAAKPSLGADTVVWDPDASGNAPKVNLTALQFGAGNTLSRGAIPFTIGNTFQLLFHAQLNSVVASNGTQIVPTALNASGAVGGVAPYEITLVGSVTETVTNLNTNVPPRSVYRLANTQSGSFIELYYDAAQNANPLQGTGYNDGTLILRGTPVTANPDVGTFTLTNPLPSPMPSFDGFGTNDYTNVSSVLGIGGTKLDVAVTFVDSAFFVAPGNGDTGRQVHVGDIVSLDISEAAPFDKVDPSKKFAATANAGTGAGPTPAATPAVGLVNGTSGPDFQTQSLIAASIRTASPTPTPSGTPTPTPSATPTVTPTPSGTPTPTPSATPTTRVVVAAAPTQVTEGQDSVITFTVKGTTTHPALTVNYTVGGNATLNTDYTLTGTPGQVTIPANTASATITLHSLTDTVKEPNGEAAKIFVAPGTGYLVPSQLDAKRASVFIKDPGA